MIRKMIGILSLATLVAMGTASIAKADTVDNFSYTANGNTFVWQLPASPVPDSGDVFPGNSFVLNNVPFSENGGPLTLGSFGFFNVSFGGGLILNVGGDAPIANGFDQLYSGEESAPTFLIGTFNLTDFLDDGSEVPGTMVISQVQVPEPSSLVLLGMGLMVLLVGFSSNRIAVPVNRN